MICCLTSTRISRLSRSMINNFKFTEKRIALFLFAIIWIYLWVRGIFVPLSHDEVATYFHYIHAGTLNPYDGAPWDANNHLLNSYLSYFCDRIFGNSEISLRLPSLLIAPIYFYYHFKIGEKLKHNLLRWIYVGSMFCTHYLVEHLPIPEDMECRCAF